MNDLNNWWCFREEWRWQCWNNDKLSYSQSVLCVSFCWCSREMFGISFHQFVFICLALTFHELIAQPYPIDADFCFILTKSQFKWNILHRLYSQIVRRNKKCCFRFAPDTKKGALNLNDEFAIKISH